MSPRLGGCRVSREGETRSKRVARAAGISATWLASAKLPVWARMSPVSARDAIAKSTVARGASSAFAMASRGSPALSRSARWWRESASSTAARVSSSRSRWMTRPPLRANSFASRHAAERAVGQVPVAAEALGLDHIEACEGRERGAGVVVAQRADAREPRGGPAAAVDRDDIEDAPAADRSPEVLVAGDEAVPHLERQLAVEHDVDGARSARRDGITAQQPDAALGVAGGRVGVDGRPVPHRAGEVGEDVELDHGMSGPARGGGRDDPVSPRDLVDVDAGQVHGGAVAFRRRLRCRVLHVETAYPNGAVRRGDDEGVADACRSGDHGARHHGAGAADGERAVHGEAKAPVRAFDGVASGRAGKFVPEFPDAASVRAGHGNGGGAFQEGRLQQRVDFVAHFRHPLRVHPVHLVDGHHAFAQSHQLQYLQVFPGLRHHPVVGGDHQQRILAPAHAGHHVVDEAVVSGDVHETHPGAVEVRVGETEVDGEAAPLLFLEAVGVHAGQGPHDRGLAVIHVPREGDDHASLRRLSSSSGRGSAPRMSSQSRPSDTRAITGTGSRRRRAASPVRALPLSADTATARLGSTWSGRAPLPSCPEASSTATAKASPSSGPRTCATSVARLPTSPAASSASAAAGSAQRPRIRPRRRAASRRAGRGSPCPGAGRASAGWRRAGRRGPRVRPRCPPGCRRAACRRRT